MARMFPERLLHDAPDSERRVFDAFKAALSDDWVVFAGVRWLSLRSRSSDGEADFIVAHPRYGVLVLEVKGGGIAFDAAKSQYTSTDRDGRVHKIKDPFAQASRSKFALLDKLHESPLTSARDYRVQHAAILPDVAVEGDLALHAPEGIVIDIAKMRDCKQALVDVFRHFGMGSDPMPEGAIDALVELLGRSWQVEATIGTHIAQHEHQVRLLTEQQFAMLDLLAGQRRALVSGCAGSGKTMLAVEKARRLAREGYRVLVTCFNQNLAAWLAAQLKDDGVEATTFLSLCARYAERAGISLTKKSDEPDDQFFGRFPDILLSALEKVPDRYDAIIVDEGQDWQEEWWVALLSLLSDPDDGILYIFYDDNQSLYGTDAAFPITGAPFHLNRNCRNTKRIHEAVVMFYQSDTAPICLNADGREPQLMNFSGSERPGVEDLIDDFVLKENVRPEDIAILTRRTRERSQWKQPPAGPKWSATWDLNDSAGKVLISSIHAFKGLERPVIIVCELEGIDMQEQKELLYVAFSRARDHLVVVGLVPGGHVDPRPVS